MKKAFIFLGLIIALLAEAQTISVSSFKLLDTDLTANTAGTMETDQNGETAALIKVVTTQTGFTFDGGALGIVKTVQKPSEVWVYVPRGLKKITISHPQLGMLRDYYLAIPIEAARTYEMVLVAGEVQTIVKQARTSQYVVFQLSPSNAVVELDGELLETADGTATKMMKFGNYNYRVQAPNYLSEAGNVTVNDPKNKHIVNISLKPNFSVVTLNAISNPVKVESWASDSIIKYSLSLDDLKTLEQHRLVQWQIINGDGIKVASGANICCCEYNEYNPTKMTLSADVLKDFIMKYNKAVEDNITTQLVQDNDKSNHSIKEKTCFVYLMIDTTNNFYKIGISNNPRYREHTLQSDKPTIELLSAKEYPTRTIAEAIEVALHKAYGEKRIRGEWFNLSEEDVEYIKETLK